MDIILPAGARSDGGAITSQTSASVRFLGNYWQHNLPKSGNDSVTPIAVESRGSTTLSLSSRAYIMAILRVISLSRRAMAIRNFSPLCATGLSNHFQSCKIDKRERLQNLEVRLSGALQSMRSSHLPEFI